MEGHCIKCQTKRTMENAYNVTMKNGRPAARGICTVCGAKIFVLGKRVEEEAASS